MEFVEEGIQTEKTKENGGVAVIVGDYVIQNEAQKMADGAFSDKTELALRTIKIFIDSNDNIKYYTINFLGNVSPCDNYKIPYTMARAQITITIKDRACNI